MKARELFNRRVPVTEQAFAELVLWEVPEPVPGSTHRYKYRLAFVVSGVCVLRFDNEAGKGNQTVTAADLAELSRLGGQTGEDIYARLGITPPPPKVP